MSNLGLMRVGDVWRNKKAKTRTIEIADINAENCYPVSVKSEIKRYGKITVSENYKCTADYVTNFYDLMESSNEKTKGF